MLLHLLVNSSGRIHFSPHPSLSLSIHLRPSCTEVKCHLLDKLCKDVTRGSLTAASSLWRVDWMAVCIWTPACTHTPAVHSVPITCTHCFMHVHQLAGRRIVKHTSGRQILCPCWEPISSCSVYSCMLIMMILNDEVSLNNDSQLKALDMAPCSRANRSFASYENTWCLISVCLVLQ